MKKRGLSNLDIKEIEPMFLQLCDRLDSMERSMLNRGMCYKCGGDIEKHEGKDQEFQGRPGILYRCRACKFQIWRLKPTLVREVRK